MKPDFFDNINLDEICNPDIDIDFKPSIKCKSRYILVFELYNEDELKEWEECEKYNDIIEIAMKFYKELTTHSNSDKQKIKSLIVIISLLRVLIQSYDEIDQFINEIDSTIFYDEIDKINAIVYAFKNIAIDSFEKTMKKIDIYNIPSQLEMKIRNRFASISNIGSNISETKEKEILITLKEHAENDTGVINNQYI